MGRIKLLLTDVDGVLTDGGIVYGIDSVEIKKFNVKDGFVCKALINDGIKLGIITGRKSEIVSKRAKELGFQYLYQGISDKLQVLNEILDGENLSLNQVAYIGDDLNDLEVLEAVGLSAAPADAFEYIKSKVKFKCIRNGGEGAFREFADYILKNNEEQY